MDLHALLNPSEPNDGPFVPDTSTPCSVQYHVKLNRDTLLYSLSHYSVGAVVPHLSTSNDRKRPEGHIFEINPVEWRNPAQDIVYSQGEPKGRRSGVYVSVLTDAEGGKVPCKKTTLTCQGSKACPFVDKERVRQPHTRADSTSFQAYSGRERRITCSPTSCDVFEATLGLWASYRDKGCFGPLVEPTYFTASEAKHLQEVLATPQKAKRGHVSKPTCQGRLRLLHSNQELIIQCEHYDSFKSRTHTSRVISASKYDVEYFEALFYNNLPVIERFENEMKRAGLGPLVPCHTVKNFSSVSVKCDNHHRSRDGRLLSTELIHLECSSTFEIYQPLEDHRIQCPRILVVCRGAHTHPVPILSKTPTAIRSEIISFLQTLAELPNLTSRRLIRSDVARLFLQRKLPHLTNPTFVDLHCSLNNLDHLQAIINHAQARLYPHGTGWEGLKHLKATEDSRLPQEQRYIRWVEETELSGDDSTEPFRLVICMKRENAIRLVRDARHLQSDISFKRVVGWLEFELGGFDRSSNTRTCHFLGSSPYFSADRALIAGVCYVRAFLNRQTAEAHRVLLLKIHTLILEDTGQQLRFRHLHATSKDDADFEGICSWTVDQHQGQAKGIGEYLQSISPPDKLDLYERSCQLQDLGPYEHLRRILRLCLAHYYRNIQETHCIPGVQCAMRSLACFRHPDWEGALGVIEEQGNKKAKDWLEDKHRCRFVFPALCWEKSLIPVRVWQSVDGTSNIIESLHQDLLIDGGHSSLVGGILKAAAYDHVRLQTHQTTQTVGIPRRYRTRDPSYRQHQSLRRQADTRSKQLTAQDDQIKKQNGMLLKARNDLRVAMRRLLRQREDVREHQGSAGQVQKAVQARDKAKAKYKKMLEASEKMLDVQLGSGRVEIELYDVDSESTM